MEYINDINQKTMEKEMIKSKPPVHSNVGLSKASVQTFDLPSIIKKMKHEYTWDEGELNSRVLIKSREKQIVLTAMHQGMEINSFQANDSVTFQIIEGKLKFHTNKESVTLKEGQYLTLNENIKYSLVTDEETVFLLTIANNTFQPAEN